MDAIVYNQKGEKTGSAKLSESVFGMKWNADLVHQVVTSMLSSARKPIAHAKTRGEVRGGGKKPWRQKGTGRARHGSTRSPIWVGGGTTHGPRNDKNYFRKVNKKMGKKAFASVLSKKAKDGEIILLDQIVVNEPKTKEAVLVLSGLSKIHKSFLNKKTNLGVISVFRKNTAIERSFKNIGKVKTSAINDLNILDALNYKYLIITEPEKSLEILEKRLKI